MTVHWSTKGFSPVCGADDIEAITFLRDQVECQACREKMAAEPVPPCFACGQPLPKRPWEDR